MILFVMADRGTLIRFLQPLSAQRSLASRYTTAVLTSLFFIALRWLLSPLIGYDAPFAILFVGIALSAFYGGLGPGLVSVLTSLALADYFLTPPLYTLGLPDTKAVLSNFLFGVTGLVVCVMGELGRSSALQASQEADIRRVAQQQALVNEERLRITEQAVSGGVWDWDIQNGSVYWSDGFQRLCDFPLHQQPTYALWLESLHPEDRDHVVAELGELFERKLLNWSMDYRIHTASGRTRWVSSRGQVFYDASGKPRRMVGINFDVTSRRFAEDAARIPDAHARTG
ncbi:MAG TPA: PAS domain-containing protein [Candidatus Angelobacter sp.]|nr:PAS domain-containing protein [Candidatus Angelobacter sp.]